MDKVATLTAKARGELFALAADQMRFHPVNVEKDFWVCWLLKQLFTMPELSGWLVFKGGTSLAKCFNLIQRFSEDIDLAVDFEKLGFTGGNDPRQEQMSHSKRDALLRKMLAACQDYIAGPFLMALQDRIARVLGPDGWTLQVSVSDANTVEFTYPASLEARLEYVRPHVVLELGTHAEPIPHEDFPIRPFAAEHYPDVFREPACPVTTVVARRTFWEKATILHAEYHRPAEKPLLPRYSRHYADVAVMSKADVRDEALGDTDLLHRVCIHKDQFYHCGWAKYLEARRGTFRLLPRDERLSDLRRDYQSMQVMFFGEALTFDEVLGCLADLERQINRS